MLNSKIFIETFMSKAQLPFSELDNACRLLYKRHFREAMDFTEGVLKDINTSDNTKLIQGLCLMSDISNTQGRYQYNPDLHQKAIAYLTQALNLAPHNEGVYWDIQIKILKTHLLLHEFKAAYDLLCECMSNQSVLDAYPEKRSIVLVAYSEYHYLQNEYDEATNFIDLAFQELQGAESNQLLLDLYSQAVRVYLRRQDYPKIYDYGQKALEIAKLTGDTEREFVGLNAIAIYHASQQDFKMAMLHFRNALDKSEEIKYNYGITFSLINIGTIYANLFNYNEALNRYKTVLSNYREILDDSNCLIILNNIGNIYYATGEPDEALEYFKKSVELAQEMNYQEMEAHVLVQLSRVLVVQKEYEEALEYANQAIALMKKVGGGLEGQHVVHITLGNIHYELGHFEPAMKYVGKGIVAAKQTKDITSEIRGYRLMSNIYKEKGDYKKALDYQIFYSQAQEKYTLAQSHRQIVDLEIRYDLEQKKKEYKLLKKFQGRLIEQNEKIKEQNLQLKEANQNLTQFAYAVSHDLKEPLRMIGSYSKLIRRRYEPKLETGAVEFFDYISNGVVQMGRLLDDLLKYATIGNDDGVDVEMVDLNEVYSMTLFRLQVSIEETEATVETMSSLPTIWTNHSYISQLFQNLISNGIKFKKVGRNAIVKVDYKKEGDWHHISFIDNGIGIPADSLSKIFQAFQRLHKKEGYKGTGIGLAICMKIVERLGGEILVESEENVGSKFTIILPSKEKQLIKGNRGVET